MFTSSKLEMFSLIAKGEMKAFDAFFDIYYGRLVNFSHLFLRDKNAAEDVVAEVLTNLLLEKERIFQMKNVESYLYASVRNKSLTQLSKAKKELLVDWSENTKAHSIDLKNPEQLMVEEELVVFIADLVEHLPKKRKMVFKLIREDGLTYKQVAEIMDISNRTVEVHLKLAIQFFRKEITVFLGQKEQHQMIQE